MQTKRIQCPQCGVVLDVKNSKNETVKEITCPSCKSMLKVSFERVQEPLDARTYYAPKGPVNESETILGDRNTIKQNEKLSVSLVHEGKSYPLEEGRNIVGRKGNTSQATVQIATDDKYMSRQHISIDVTNMGDGMIKAVLSNYQNKNSTMIEGQPIETGDQIRLADGNTITMGKTTVTFKMS